MALPFNRSANLIVLKLRVLIITGISLSLIFVFQKRAIAQNEKEKKNENVFLHPKMFYKKYFPRFRIKPNPPDTSFIKTYPNNLSVSMHLLVPSIRMDISPGKINAAGNSKFRTDIENIVGFSVGYRFISAGFAFMLKSDFQAHHNYARSYYRTATIKYNSGAYSLQFMYQRIKGFTDVNIYNSADQKHYTKRSDIANKEFKFEGLFSPSWKKYSYIAPFTFTQRQVKSRVGFLFKAGIYYSQLSGDSSLIGRNQLLYYDHFNNVNVIRTLAIKLAPGVGGNFVFLRHYYLSLAVFPSYDLYFYKYLKNLNEKVRGRQTFAFVINSKASLGYQSKRLYAGLRYEMERKHVSLHSAQLTNRYTYAGIELGYRFTTPGFIKKIYKETMPPGM